MSEIKLPVRYSGHGRIIDGSEQTIAFAELPDSGATLADDAAVRDARAAQIVAALNLAPALAALEAVAREASARNQQERDVFQVKLRHAIEENDALAERNLIGRLDRLSQWDERIDAALALAGAPLDRKDGKP